MTTHELPPPVQMVQLLAGFQLSQALYTVAVLGVPDRLGDGPRPVAALTDEIQVNPRSLYRLLRTLASINVFTESEAGVFGLTPLGETLTTGPPGSMRDLAIVWMETHYAPFAALTRAVRTGEPASDLHYGQPFFEWLAGRPEQVARFTGAMANLTEGIKFGAVGSLSLEGVHELVDVGGADGTMLSLVLGDRREMQGVLFDLPHVVADAPKALAARGVADRVRCVGGDFFESVPEGDGYLLSFILHDWDDERALRILTNVARAGGAGARLEMIEFVVPPGDEPHMSKMIDLTMLGMLTGCERTEAEWRELVGSAGFEQIEVIDSGTPVSVVRAVAR